MATPTGARIPNPPNADSIIIGTTIMGKAIINKIISTEMPHLPPHFLHRGFHPGMNFLKVEIVFSLQ